MTKLPFISIIWHLLHLWAWIHLLMYEKTKQCHVYLLDCNLTHFYKRTLGLEGKEFLHLFKTGIFLKECYIHILPLQLRMKSLILASFKICSLCCYFTTWICESMSWASWLLFGLQLSSVKYAWGLTRNVTINQNIPYESFVLMIMHLLHILKL